MKKLVYVLFSLLFPLISSEKSVHHHHESLQSMQSAADLFIKSLEDKQLPKALYEFQSKQRTVWNYLPDKYIKPDGKRYGLPITEMNAKQRIFAYGLLNSALSQKGILKVNTVMVLEQLLFELTKDKIRNPELYYVSIYGTPSKTKTWGWRFEGHHLSINITLVEGHHLSVTPIFLGGNPAKVLEGKYKGLTVLSEEDTLARVLVKSLTPEQTKKVMLKATPKDVISKFTPKVNRNFFDLKNGLTYSSLSVEQQKQLQSLVKVYILKFRPELIKQLDNSPLSETNSMVFAWAGGTELGDGHYYRIVTKGHLIEFHNIKNKTGHAHCVWREFDGDFGEDLLLKHLHEKHK